MIKLSQDHLDKINFKMLNEFNCYCWIAGGALTSVLMDEAPKDIDIYFSSEADKIHAAAKILDAGGTFRVNYPNGIRLEYRGSIYDLIYLKPTVEETISFFDYTICGIAVDKFGKVFTVDDFEKHFNDKEIHYTKNDPTAHKNPINKCKRLLKYINKGFSINDKNLKMLLRQAVEDHEKK